MKNKDEKKIARVTFEQPEKWTGRVKINDSTEGNVIQPEAAGQEHERWRLLKSKSHEQPFYFDGTHYVSIDGMVRLDKIRSDGDYFVIPTFVKPQQ